jgi:hypothetical protein
MRLAGHIARTGQIGNAHTIVVGKPEGMKHSEGPDVNGKAILEWFLGSRVGRCGLDFSGSGYGSVV